MNEPIMIVGEPGTGKTTSIRTLDPAKVLLINLDNKPMPFRAKDYAALKYDEKGNYLSGNVINIVKTNKKGESDSYFDKLNKILGWCKNQHFTEIIIDDFQSAMANEMFDRIKEMKFDKWVDIGLGVRNLILQINSMPEHILVFMMIHSETDYDQAGNKIIKAKTVGKLIDKNLTLEGKTTIVLGTEVVRANNKTDYNLITQSDGTRILRSPLEMFEFRIPNDLAFVSKTVREYRGIQMLDKV